MENALFAPPAAVPADNQWVFRSRNPDAFFRHNDLAISFRYAQFVTSNPREAEFLLGVEKDSHGREVQCLLRPRPPLQPVAEEKAEHAPTADRQRRTRRKRGN